MDNGITSGALRPDPDGLPEKIELNSNSEFEAALIEIVKMHREKTKAYGGNGDPFNNFTEVGAAEGIKPLQAAAIMGAKHRAVKAKFIHKKQTITSYTDDAFLDSAVYAVIDLCLYRRLDR
jgi:hypothetical protein